MPVVPLFDAQVFILARPDSDIAQRYLRLRLEQLPAAYRVGFAAACVERQVALLRQELGGASSEVEELGISLDLVWESLLHQALDRRRLDDMLHPCAELFRCRASGAGCRAVLACLEAAQTGACEPVLRVGQNLLHALEAQAFAAAGPCWPNPGIRLERERQHRDLCELHKTASAPSPNLIRRLRDRAAMEAGLPADEPGLPAREPQRRQRAR